MRRLSCKQHHPNAIDMAPVSLFRSHPVLVKKARVQHILATLQAHNRDRAACRISFRSLWCIIGMYSLLMSVPSSSGYQRMVELREY